VATIPGRIEIVNLDVEWDMEFSGTVIKTSLETTNRTSAVHAPDKRERYVITHLVVIAEYGARNNTGDDTQLVTHYPSDMGHQLGKILDSRDGSARNLMKGKDSAHGFLLVLEG
jgi:hypothetical protein